MQSKRHMDGQSFETKTPPKKRQKNNQDQVHSDGNIFQEPTTLKTKSSLDDSIYKFYFLNETESKKNKYGQYEKLIFLKLIKCIEHFRKLSCKRISEEILQTDFSTIAKYAALRSSGIGSICKTNLLSYLYDDRNLDILLFYMQAGTEIGLDHEKDVRLLIKYQGTDLNTRRFNGLGETDKEFQQQIDDLKKNIQDAQQATTRNANQQFMAIFGDENKKTYHRVLKKSKQLTFNWSSEASTTNSSTQLETKQLEGKNADPFDFYIANFKLTGEGKYLYLQYEKLVFLKLIKCIQILHKNSLHRICKNLSIALNTVSNLISDFQIIWISLSLKNALLTYLNTNQDIQKLYEQIGIEIHLDHALDIHLFRKYQKKRLFNQKSFHTCQQDNDFQQQIRRLDENIQISQQLNVQNENQQFIAIFDRRNREVFDRVLEKSKTRTINPYQISEENTPEDKNLPPETINELHEKYLSETENISHDTIQSYHTSPESLTEIETPIQTSIGYQEMQFSHPEIQLQKDDMSSATNPFYSDSDYYGDVNQTPLFDEDQLNNGIEWDMSILDATSAVKGYQNNNLFARQQSDTRTSILPKTWNPK